MQNTRYDAVFFDFDGTLIDSEKLKKDAFFELFPSEADYERIVREVLSSDPDGSRYAVIPRMVDRIERGGLSIPGGENAEALIARYGDLVLDLVAKAEEMPGATYVLKELQTAGVYLFLCSNTPEEPLLQVLAARSWLKYFNEISGYPARKEGFVANVLRERSISPDRVLMVGDGPSDEEAARRNSVEFIRVDGFRNLDEVIGLPKMIQGV